MPVSAGAGVIMHAKPGDRVTAGQPLLELHADNPGRFARALESLEGSFDIGPDAVDPVPLIIDRIYEVLSQFVEQGMSLVVVEQYVPKVLALAQTVCILIRGEVIHRGRADELDTDEIYAKYLGVI